MTHSLRQNSPVIHILALAVATLAAMSVKLLKIRLSNQLYLPWCEVAKEKNQGKYPAKERTNNKKQREGKNLFSTSKLKDKTKN